MKNSVLLTKDLSCSDIWYFIHYNSSKMYRYPIAYEDGLISRLKSASNGRKAWGIVFKDYIISIHPAEKEMTPPQIEDYCKEHTFAGLPYCVVNGNVMKKVMRRLPSFNHIIKELGGVPFEAKWYVVKNNEYVAPNGVYSPTYYALHPHTSFASENRPHKCIWTIQTYQETTFYPAIKL